MTLVITEKAAQQILASVSEGGQQAVDLRVAAKRKEDGSIEYAMGFDERQKEDAHIHWHGVSVVVGPTSTELLSGTTLDYVELEEGKHEFIFMNPNDPNYSPPTE
jgi:iron-sulfur cluster assembly protein